MWCFSSYFLLKLSPQTEQLNGLSPVWVSLCLFNIAFILNLAEHKSHWYGLASECEIWWCFSPHTSAYLALHILHTWVFSCSCFIFEWCNRATLVTKLLWQDWQVKFSSFDVLASVEVKFNMEYLSLSWDIAWTVSAGFHCLTTVSAGVPIYWESQRNMWFYTLYH